MTEDSKPAAKERSNKIKSPRRSKSPKRIAEDSKPAAEERIRTSRSPKRSQEDRESKNRARRERDGTASTPGAVSSISSSRDPGSRKAREDRSSNRPGAVSASSSGDRASRKAKEDQKSGSKPGAQSADSKSDKSRHKEGRSSRDDDEKRKYRSSKKDKATVGAQSVSSSDKPTREERKKAREASRTKPPPVASAASTNEKDLNVAPVGDGGMEVQAELVQETDEREALRQEIRQELQAENAQSRDPAVGESGGTNQDQSSSSRNWKKITAVIVVIVVIAAVGAYFGTRSSSKAVPATVATTSPTPATVVVPGTPEPTLELTESPSTSPSAKLLFDAPSPEDCAAIASGEQVTGQENMKLMSLDVKMKMTLDTESSLGPLLQDLQARIQNVMIPQLTGCTDVEAAASQGSNVRSLKGGRKSAFRKLSTDPNRYAIGNGEVLVVTQAEKSCGENCYVIVVPLELYLRSEDVRYFIVAQLVGNAFEATLAEILNLADKVIKELIVDGVLGKDPTAQPSAAPTGLPSVSPSTLPSGLPSVRPSGIPSVMPVMGQPTAMPVTGQPTKAPTPPPTASPTLAATPPPTIAPTPPPTIGDSSSPTDAPVFQESCTGAEACSDRSGGSIGGGSCIGDWSCHGHVDVTVGSNSCLAPYSCTCISLNRFIFDDACQNSGDCCSAEGGPLNVPSTSCTPAGEQTCLGASSSSIGQRSCNASFRTCYRATATIGNDSCNNGGCQGVHGNIGDNSCNGDLACPWYEPMSIGSGSCNCEECCKCLQDQYVDSGLQVPNNSCNELAPPGVAVDFVNGGSGPYQYCCDGGTAAPVEPPPPTPAPVACPSKCSGPDACSNANPAAIGCDSCIGEQTCLEASSPSIGQRSCKTNFRTCYRATATIGNDSCNDGGCQGVDGTIGDNSCNGDLACPWFEPMSIGNGSCNCEQCCKCLQDQSPQIPANSCNERAPTGVSVDFVSGGSGPYQYCCSVDDVY